jgi:hypothetical protein
MLNLKEMRKLSALMLLGLLMGCGENSSPEGRMSNKIEGVQAQIDSLKKQNALILDSLGKINENLKRMTGKYDTL